MEPQPASVIRIGICDDHPVFRAGVAALVGDEDDLLVAFEASNAAELLARLGDAPSAAAEARIDVLILDFDLPDRHGLELIRAASARCRVLVLSAFDDPQMIRAALERGATGFVRKDAPPRTLLRAIHDAAKGRTVLGAELAVRVAGAMRDRTPDLSSRLESLTERQREVVALLADGHSNREIATALFVTEGTVKNHVSQILQLLDVPDRTRLAVLLARRTGPAGPGRP